MARTDMSRQAVTVRLIRTAQLRRLCLALRRLPRGDPPSARGGPVQPPGAKRPA